MNQHLLSSLLQARDSGELSSIYCDSRRPQGAVHGFVDFIGQDSFLVRVVSIHSFYDGFTHRLLKDIYRIESGGEYEQKLTFLFHARAQKHPDFLPPLDVSSDLQRETLLAAQRQNFLVRVEILGEDWRDGWVESVGEEILTLQLVNESGHQDGRCQVELETLNKFNCDDAALQDVKLLTRWSEIQPPPN